MGMRREGFWRFFAHVAGSDPSLVRGIIAYASILAVGAVIRLAVDSVGAWLMGMVNHRTSGEAEARVAVEKSGEGVGLGGSDGNGMEGELALLAMLVLLEVVQDVLRKHMFVLLNWFLRDPFHIAGVRYALKAIHDSSPYWIAGRNPSMLRKHIEEGLGSYRAVLARMSYIAPVALVAITSLTSLGLWFSPKYTLIIVLGWSIFYFTYGVSITSVIREGDREVQTNRNKFSHMLELEYGRIGQVATRGEAEFIGLAQRLSAYESFFPLASAPFRWRSSRLQSTQVLLLHSLAAVVLMLFVYERFKTGGRAERLGQFVYLYNLLQRCLQSMQTLLEHKHYFMNEASPHVNLERLLEERVPPAPFTPEHVCEQALTLLDGRFEIAVHRAAIASNALDSHQFRLLVERQITAAAGDVVIIAGPNGVGKSTFLKALAGELQSHNHSNTGYDLQITASLCDSTGKRMEFEFTNVGSTESQRLDVFKCLRDCGVIAELPQGELRDIRRTRIGDVFWRMNGLLADPIADKLELPVGASVQNQLQQLLVDCLQAVGLDRRLRIDKLTSDEVTNLVISDMSGGELQRVRLAAFFYLEIIRWQVRDGELPAVLLQSLQQEPARVVILDEPDRSLDAAGANTTIANLWMLLGKRRSSVVLFVVLHSEIQPAVWHASVRNSRSRLITLSARRDPAREATSVLETSSVLELGTEVKR